MSVVVDLNILPGAYSISRLPVGPPLPGWIGGEGLVNVTQAADEVSVVCRSDRVPGDIETSAGWTAIEVSTTFDFDEAGVVLSVVRPISEAGLGVFVISTFLRDYLLVRREELAHAKSLLAAAGHRVSPDGGDYLS